MFFKRGNSVEKQRSNFRSASFSHCFRNLSLTIIWKNLSLSNYKRMKKNLKFRKNTYVKKQLFRNVQQNIFFQSHGMVERCHKCIRATGLSFD